MSEYVKVIVDKLTEKGLKPFEIFAVLSRHKKEGIATMSSRIEGLIKQEVNKMLAEQGH